MEIARTPEEVFDYLADVSNLPSWQSGVHAARREGSQIHESRHMLGRELSTTLEIEQEERPRLFTLRAVNSPVPFTVRHELERNGGGTTLRVVGEGDAGMLPGFAAGIMARRAEKQFRKDFERLKRLLEDRKITLEIDDAAEAWLADKGYDPVYGARPLKRVIQRELQNPLAQQILEGRIPDGSTVHIGASPLGLVIGQVAPAMAAQ